MAWCPARAQATPCTDQRGWGGQGGGAQKKPTASLNRVPQHVGGVVDGSLTFTSLQSTDGVPASMWGGRQVAPFLCVSVIRMGMHLSSRDSRLSEAPKRSLGPSMSLDYLSSVPLPSLCHPESAPRPEGASRGGAPATGPWGRWGLGTLCAKALSCPILGTHCRAAICKSCSELWVWRAGWFIDGGSHKLEF